MRGSFSRGHGCQARIYSLEKRKLTISGRRKTPTKTSKKKAWPRRVNGSRGEAVAECEINILVDSVEGYNYLLGGYTVLIVYYYKSHDFCVSGIQMLISDHLAQVLTRTKVMVLLSEESHSRPTTGSGYKHQLLTTFIYPCDSSHRPVGPSHSQGSGPRVNVSKGWSLGTILEVVSYTYQESFEISPQHHPILYKL